MKRLIALTLSVMLILSLSGCGTTNKAADDDGTPTIVMPDSKTASTVNGYKQTDTDNTATETEPEKAPESDANTTTSPEASTGYYANKSSKKFHISTCSYAKNIKSENLYATESRDELINDGYQPCKKCNP